MTRSRWVPVDWGDLPGWGSDQVSEVWPALLRSCARARSVWVQTCSALRQQTGLSTQEQQLWLMQRLQPHRIEAAQGSESGLLTAYYEPVLTASRVRRPGFEVPIHAPPPELLRSGSGKAWYSRQEIETQPQAQSALRGRDRKSTRLNSSH